MAETVARTTLQPDDSVRRLARLAGALYVTVGVLMVFGLYHAPFVRPDISVVAQTIANLSDRAFSIAVVNDVLAAALAVPLALVLHELLKRVDRLYAALMSLWLMVAVPISFVVALNYVAVRILLTAPVAAGALTASERHELAMLFVRLHRQGVFSEEIFWGLWLLPFGVLVFRSRFLPRALGVTLVIAGVAYVAHSIVSLLWPGESNLLYERITMVARGAGEFPIMLWLLIRGARPPSSGEPAICQA
jgi:hypothetical protein